jgi:hypothetical protein
MDAEARPNAHVRPTESLDPAQPSESQPGSVLDTGGMRKPFARRISREPTSRAVADLPDSRSHGQTAHHERELKRQN